MRGGKPNISYLVRAEEGYYTGDGWDKDVREACIYATRREAESALRKAQSAGAAVACVIQNLDFDYYDGENFVYSLREARIYSPEDAEAEAKRLAR